MNLSALLQQQAQAPQAAAYDPTTNPANYGEEGQYYGGPLMRYTATPAMTQKSWYPSYLQALNSGDSGTLKYWAQNVAPTFRDFDGAADGDFVGSQVSRMQGLAAKDKTQAGVNLGIGLGGLAIGGATAFAGGGAAAAGDAALAGGGEVGSGYAASAPGAFGSSGAGATATGTAVGADTIAGGAGTDALTGGPAVAGSGATGAAPMGDWWTDLGMTAADVGGGGAAPGGDWWTQYGLTAGDVGASGTTGAAATSGVDLAALAKQYGPALVRALPGILGAGASKKQAGALQDLSSKYAEYGAPSRARFEASMTPGFDPSSIPGYSGAVDTASKSLLARLSATGGNPYGNPGGLIDANKQIISGTALPAIQAYQNQNANTGFGGTLNAAGSFGGQAIGAQGNVYNAIGAGINDVANPPQTLAQQLAELKKAGLYSSNSLQ